MKLITIFESIQTQTVIDRLASVIGEKLNHTLIPELIEFCNEHGGSLSEPTDNDDDEQHYIYSQYIELTKLGALIHLISAKDFGPYLTSLGQVRLELAFLGKGDEHPNDAEFFPNGPGLIRIYVRYDNQHDDTHIDYESWLAHELRHALDFLKHKVELDKINNKGTFSLQNKDIDEYKHHEYLRLQSEVSARTTQAMRAIRQMLVGYKEHNMDNKELENIILRVMHKFSLIEIFNTKKQINYSPTDNHDTNRSFNMTNVPSDNPQFRKVFNKIYTYAKHIMEQIQNEITTGSS